MKKICVFAMLIGFFTVHSQFVGFGEKVSKNKFLGLGMSTCSPETNHAQNSYQKGYDCGNDTISQLLNINFLSPEFLGQQFYIFNDFMYWMSPHNNMGKWNGKDAKYAKKQADIAAQPDQLFGNGVFMIVMGTSTYLQQIVAPNKICPEGQELLVAQLKYNNGNSLNTWSQDSICLALADSFTLQISSDADNLLQVIDQNMTQDQKNIDWMKDNGPTENYQQAGDSPRKIKFMLQKSSVKNGLASIVEKKESLKKNKK